MKYFVAGVNPEKFYTLPVRKKQKQTKDYPQNSIDRKTRRRNSDELGISSNPPKKPPRTFSSRQKSPQRSSIFNLFKKSDKSETEPKKSNLRRSVSDATNLKSKALRGSSDHDRPIRKRTGSDSEDPTTTRSNKKQLSPIIEVTPREDYFSPRDGYNEENKENVENSKTKSIKSKKKKPTSVTEQLKEYIDEVDSELFRETGVRPNPPKVEKHKEPEVVIIDVEKAEKISGGKKSSLGKKFKALANKKGKIIKNKAKDSISKKKTVQKPQQIKREPRSKRQEPIGEPRVDKHTLERTRSSSPAPRIKEAIESLENQAKKSTKMIHSSQQPPDKPPLTKGRTVDTMVKRLSSDKCSPPPKTSIMITPNVTVQHNNNQPFSYTRGLSPDKSYSPNEEMRNPGAPVIYAQVVCGQNGTGPNKQTVHTTYTNGKKHLPHSDSDEGLGYEENFGRKYEAEKTVTRFGDDYDNNLRNKDYLEDDR